MSGKEDDCEDLSQVEALLASLSPRGDRVDRRWREFLAKEAALGAELAAQARIEAGTKAQAPPGSVCVVCGRGAAVARGTGRWAWPAAFSAMTAVAATLLVMLALQPRPEVAGSSAPAGVPANPEAAGPKQPLDSPPSTAPSSAPPSPAPPSSVPPSSVPARSNATTTLAWADGLWIQHALESGLGRPGASGDAQLWREVLQGRPEALKLPTDGTTTSPETGRAPVTSRDLLESLLHEAGPEGPQTGTRTKEPTKPRGVRS